jgi:hypothetical protein
VGLGVNYEADIVSGASVAVVDAPSAGVDVISTATQLDDIRHTIGGSVRFEGEYTSLSATYNYGTESDYVSHGFSVAGRAEMFERNTAFDLSYARGFDSVCNLPIADNQEAVDRPRLPTADGCFSDVPDRAGIDLSLQTFQGGWTQAWAPILITQLVATAQLLNGFQGNPYRAVWLGRSGAQENHPDNRARYALGLDTRLWLKPIEGALRLFVRGYRDTWDILSITAELSYEQSIGENLTLQVRGRYYDQTAAIFYSDDYARLPRGDYFTGDRELSAMSSITVGGKLQLEIPAADDGMVLGFMQSLRFIAKGDVMLLDFGEFHYGRAPVPNTTAIVATLSLESAF